MYHRFMPRSFVRSFHKTKPQRVEAYLKSIKLNMQTDRRVTLLVQSNFSDYSEVQIFFVWIDSI